MNHVQLCFVQKQHNSIGENSLTTRFPACTIQDGSGLQLQIAAKHANQSFFFSPSVSFQLPTFEREIKEKFHLRTGSSLQIPNLKLSTNVKYDVNSPAYSSARFIQTIGSLCITLHKNLKLI